MKKILTSILFLIGITTYSQKEANIWYFGKNAGIDFNSGTPKVLLDGQINTNEGCATISSSDGSLLFYTDGKVVYDRGHNLMPNSGLNGDNSSTHSAIIVPNPNLKNIYYIFTVGSGGFGSISYSELDMNLNNGFGDITSIKNEVLFSPVNEKLTAIKKSTNDGYWVVGHKHNSNEFITYDVTSSGVNTTPKISSVGSNTGFFNVSGQIKISPDNSRLAVARGGEVQLFDFDNSTGNISNPQTLDSGSINSYGIEFSPNGNLLYVSFFGGVYQYNLKAGSLQDIIDSKIAIVSVSNEGFASLQIAPDGKIYVARQDKPYIDFIDKPNLIGPACDYKYEGLNLGGRESNLGLPTFIQSFFRIDDVTFTNTCFSDTTNFTLNNTVDTVTWNFGDPTTGVNNIGSGITINHTFSAPGVYTVTTTATLGTEVSTFTTDVVIYEVPKATKPNNLTICDDDNNGFYNFNLKNLESDILNGQNPDNYSVDYYANSIDYDNNIPITDYTDYINANAFQQQTIIASVKNKSNTNCETTTSFTIQVYESPTSVSTVIPNLSACDNTSVGSTTDGKIIFNLKDRETAILNGQSDSDFIVSYFLDENLTQLITNPTEYVNTSSIQRIYSKVENKQNSTCFAKTSYLLEVFELPIINKTVSITQCDNNDINGFSFFNLNEVKEKIITNPANYTITFHEEKTQAENNQNAIVNITTYENQIVSADTIWARVENSNGCFEVSEINLFVSTTQIPSTLLKSYFQCDDGANLTDGIATFNFSDITNEILNIFPLNQQLDINYYRNEADALSEENAISDISNYQNIGYPNQQTIYVRVDSKVDNSCLGLGAHISLHVEKVPIANPVSINPECDNDRDGFFVFDTSIIQNTIIGSQTNVSVRYFDENGVELSNPLPNPFISKSQKITARIENATSNDLDGKCFDETILDFIVNTVPVANPIAPQTACDDDFDGIVAFNTSQIQSTIIGNQTGLIIKYFDENNNTLPSPLPNPFVTASQSIRVRIENPSYDVCYEETTIDFTVYEKPFVDIIEEDIICITNSSQLELKVENPNVNYTYTWKDENDTIIGNSASVNVSKGGIYKVFATSAFGCNSDEEEILIRESSISTININDIEVQDDSENNFIKINTENLGLGDYEFRLLDQNFKVLFDYQNEPIFDNLDGGVYNLEINDKNACGAVPFEIALISFPKFFTPNGDGVNDFWQIKGIDKSYYKSGVITIFNRFGKTISSFTINDNGWDGTYNGIQMIANDYWFRVVLIKQNDEVKNRSGYFSLLRN